MVVATEVSSDRVPVAYMPLLAAVMAGTWVATAAAKGDYRYDAEAGEVDAWSAMMGLPVVKAITEASLTWAAASLAACAVFAALVSRGFMEGDLSEPLLEVTGRPAEWHFPVTPS